MLEVAVNRDCGNAHPLDRVVWNALTGRQNRFAVGDELVVRFAPDVAPFAAMIDTSVASFDALCGLVRKHGPAALVTIDKLEIPSVFSIVRHVTLLQMVWHGESSAAPSALDELRLAEREVPDMLALTAATQPGPFAPRTVELGDYFGIRRQGTLVAMAGERKKIDGYTEISAVCVDPAFRGQRLANGLIKVLIAAIRARGETPFLHVLASNHGAIALYRTLGFVERREMHLTLLDEAQP